MQLVVHDDTDLDKFFHERESRDGLSLHPMIDCIETVAMSFSDGGRTAEELRRNWQMQRKLQIHSDDVRFSRVFLIGFDVLCLSYVCFCLTSESVDRYCQ